MQARRKEGQIHKHSRQDKLCISKELKSNLLAIANEQKSYYFIAGPRKEVDIAVSAKITKEMHTDNNNGFAGIEYFKGTFSLQVREGVKPYQAHP